jgi:hypothetical protein
MKMNILIIGIIYVHYRDYKVTNMTYMIAKMAVLPYLEHGTKTATRKRATTYNHQGPD